MSKAYVNLIGLYRIFCIIVPLPFGISRPSLNVNSNEKKIAKPVSTKQVGFLKNIYIY
jgi:hypothetical protein